MPYGRILKDFDIETGRSGVDQRKVERKNGIILILMEELHGNVWLFFDV